MPLIPQFHSTSTTKYIPDSARLGVFLHNQSNLNIGNCKQWSNPRAVGDEDVVKKCLTIFFSCTPQKITLFEQNVTPYLVSKEAEYLFLWRSLIHWENYLSQWPTSLCPKRTKTFGAGIPWRPAGRWGWARGTWGSSPEPSCEHVVRLTLIVPLLFGSLEKL